MQAANCGFTACGTLTIGKWMHLRSLTALRFVAAAAVFLYHLTGPAALGDADNAFTPGAAGVSLFFVLSGLVLTWSARPGEAPRCFWRRRFARIYPAYFAVWVLVVIARAVNGARPDWHDLFALTLLQSWVPREEVYFATSPVFWSLSCEGFFYLIFPWLHGRLSLLGRERRVLLLGGIPIAILVLAFSLEPAPSRAVAFWAVNFFPPFRMLEFVVGVLLGLELRAGTRVRVRPWAASLLLLAAYAVACVFEGGSRANAILLIPIAVLLAALATADLDGAPSPLRREWLVRLGVWSYCLYLVHTTVIGGLLIIFGRFFDVLRPPSTATAILVTLLTAILAIAVAATIHHVVEAPAERRLRQPRRTAGGRGPS